nr:ATP-binding protein [Saccharophagus degradans]
MVVAAFYFRISAPLDRLTSVFESLAEGTRRVHIPDINRKDEIGLLARAANVFRSKNDQTEALLVKTEQMVKEQTLLNEHLQEEKLRAERALSVKTDFLANMSHELRTPLNAIIGFTVRLLKKKDQLQNQQVNAMEVIERNGRHLLAMINDILDLSKIEANKLDLHIASVQLPQLCADIMGQISLTAEEKSLRIDYEYVDVPVIQSDSVRLSQILLNLLSNAIKYTESGGVSVKIARNSIDSITLTIADTGVGISEADQKKLFSRFEQFDDKTKFQVGKGTGLGLAIVANLCKILGIQVSVESTLGLGSCFTLVIPLVHEG